MSHDRLGKGLGALLGDYLEPDLQPGEVQKIRIGSILPNPLQPRRSFVQAELEGTGIVDRSEWPSAAYRCSRGRSSL